MRIRIRATGALAGRASQQLLSNNIEAYENTIPSMLSDRLRNPKFAGPENQQTGMAAEWEPVGNTMTGMSCRLISGMYLSGREAQLVHNYTQNGGCGILQSGVQVRAGEEFEVEMWARAQHNPVELSIELRMSGHSTLEPSRAAMTVDLAHWHRRTCRIMAPGTGGAYFQINVPGNSRIVIDQIHLRPMGQTHVSRELPGVFVTSCLARSCGSPAAVSHVPIIGSMVLARCTCDRFVTTRCLNTRSITISVRMSISSSACQKASGPSLL